MTSEKGIVGSFGADYYVKNTKHFFASKRYQSKTTLINMQDLHAARIFFLLAFTVFQRHRKTTLKILTWR